MSQEYLLSVVKDRVDDDLTKKACHLIELKDNKRIEEEK